MSLPLEDEIMMEIGLGNHFYWFNGSSSCRAIRLAATEKLATIITIHANEGDPIDLVKERLLFRLQKIAENGDSSDYELTKTWQACADVIRTQIEMYTITNEKDRISKIDETMRHLNCYLPRKISNVYLERNSVAMIINKYMSYAE